MTGFYEKDTPALQKMREAESMMKTRDHTAKGPKPTERSLGPTTIIGNNYMQGVNLNAVQGPFMPRESKMEDAGREQALRIVNAVR